MTLNAEQKREIQAMVDKAHAAGDLDSVDALDHMLNDRFAHMNKHKAEKLLKLYGPKEPA